MTLAIGATVNYGGAQMTTAFTHLTMPAHALGVRPRVSVRLGRGDAPLIRAMHAATTQNSLAVRWNA